MGLHCECLAGKGSGTFNRCHLPVSLLVVTACGLVACGQTHSASGSAGAGFAGSDGVDPAKGGDSGSSVGGTTDPQTTEAGAGGCSGADCPVATCIPGQRACHDGDVYVCASDGVTLRPYQSCGANDICDPDTRVCVLRVCSPGALGCNGRRVTQCNELGSVARDTTTDCGASGQICYQGHCRDGVCQPGDTSCVGNLLYHCAEDGSSNDLFQTCGDAFHCTPSPFGAAACIPIDCDPNVPFCVGNSAVGCDEFGRHSAFKTDCGALVCQAGVCKPVDCTNSALSCLGADIITCDASGVGTRVLGHCSATETCGTLFGEVDCVQRPCAADGAGCIANVRGICAGDQVSLSSVAEDCTASGKVCDGSGACSNIIVDTMGESMNTGALGSQPVGEVVDVYSARRLTQLQAELQLDVAQDLVWRIAESDLADVFHVVATETTHAQAGDGFFATSALSYVLQPDHRYHFGVTGLPGTQAAVHCGQGRGTPLSFGAPISSVELADGGTLASIYSCETRLRFTTQLP